MVPAQRAPTRAVAEDFSLEADGGSMDVDEERITAENVTRELLASRFQDAGLSVEFDGDGDVVVTHGCRVYVLPDPERRRIRMMAVFRFLDSAPEAAKLEAVNRINSDYILVRASVHGEALNFDYDLSLEGGVAPRALVLLVQRFSSIPHVAVQDCAGSLVD